MRKEVGYKKRKQIMVIATRFLISLMILSVTFSKGTMEVFAENKTNALRESVQKATVLLEKVLKSQYEQKEEELKDLIMEKEYDYTSTMETFYGNGNPFKDMDYLNLLAVYGTIKEYCDTNGIPLGEGLGGVSFLSMEVKESTMKIKTPVLIPIYKDFGNGYFELVGNETVIENSVVPLYEEYEPGRYQYAGMQKVTVKEEKLLYGEVTLSVIEPDMLYEIFQVPKEKLQDACQKRFMKLTNEVNRNTLSQSVFIHTRENFYENSEIAEEEIEYLINIAPEERQTVLKTAISLIGQVPYEFGGKAKMPGYDMSWWIYEGNEQKGLDCSGFVQWTFMTSGFPSNITEQMISTTSIKESFSDCTYEELMPGDIGLLNLGETINHTGIYLGDGYFIHCSSGSGTVVVNKFPFRYFKKIEIEKSDVDMDTLTNYYKNNYTIGILEENIQEQDVKLLAKLIEHEAGNQGYNGWVAVGEVVLNRVESDQFPNTITEVIYQDNQFTNSHELSSVMPRDGIEEVARNLLSGRVKIFNNKDVLYFKNPMITDEISPQENIDWGGHKWYRAVNEHAFYLK